MDPASMHKYKPMQVEDSADSAGRTTLHYAASSGSVKLVKLLLEMQQPNVEYGGIIMPLRSLMLAHFRLGHMFGRQSPHTLTCVMLE